jgi:NAD(P)-dependent dehydrogenase (short-subunit alcohol dehydrogenase family)
MATPATGGGLRPLAFLKRGVRALSRWPEKKRRIAPMPMQYGATYPSLKDRVVLITGGGSGIGEAIVTHFAAQGSKVGFLDIKPKESQALADRLSGAGHVVHFEQTDLSDIAALKASIDRVRGKLGPITILVNNAANDDRHKIEDVTPEYFDNRINVNLRHHFFAIQAVVPDMKQAGGGSIVNVTSTSWMIGSRGMPVYVAAKSAVYGLVRGLARELGEHNIRINAFAPGWIMTERQKALWTTPEALERLMIDQCIKRTLTPDDMARAILFFASDEAAAATNQNFVFDGGWL